MFDNKIEDISYGQKQQEEQQQEIMIEDENDLFTNIINGLVFDINKLEKEISVLQEISTTPPTPTTPRLNNDQSQHSYKEELDNVTNSILQEFELSKISSLGNSNNNINNRKMNIGDNPDKLLEIQLINKIFDINKAFDNNSNNLISSFQNCSTNEQSQQQQQQSQSPPIIGRSNNNNNNNSNINNNNNNSSSSGGNGNGNSNNSNNVTIGSIRDLNKIQPQNINEFGEWKSLIDEELSDLYTLVKELKRKIPSTVRTNSSNNLNSSSPVTKSKNKDLYLYNNTFTNILQLKNDLVSMIQSPMLNKEYETSSTLTREDSGNSITNNNSNNNNSPNKKSVKQLVLLFSP